MEKSTSWDALDEGVIRRLAFGKSLQYLSTELLAHSNRVTDAESLVVADASTDVILRGILDRKGIRLNERVTFDRLLDELGTIAPEMGLASLDRLHSARNMVQHKFLVPAGEEVRELVQTANAKVSMLVATLLSVDLAKISVSALFLDDTARATFTSAESAYRANDMDNAITWLVACFQECKYREQDRLHGSGITLKRLTAEYSDAPPEVVVYIKAVQDELEILKLRIDYKAFRRFADLNKDLITAEYAIGRKWPADAVGMHLYWQRLLGPQLKGKVTSALGSVSTPEKKQEWLAFAFPFVERCVLTWQSINRLGGTEILGQAIDDFTKILG